MDNTTKPPVHTTAENLTTCGALGPRPTVPTLMRLKTALANDTAAIVLQPNCSWHKLPLMPSDEPLQRTLNASFAGIQQVQSLPTINVIHLEVNSVALADFSEEKQLHQVILAENQLRSLDQFRFPTQLYELDLVANEFASFKRQWAPPGLGCLHLSENKIKNLQNFDFPTTLVFLNLSYNAIESVHQLVLPLHIEQVYLEANQITSLENIILPHSLRRLQLDQNPITHVRGVRFSKTLYELAISGKPIQEFEIRESDVAIFQRLGRYSGSHATNSTCSDRNASKRTIKGQEFCVITDDHFRGKYGSKFSSQRPGDLESLHDGSSSSAAASPPSTSKCSMLSCGSSSTMMMTVLVAVVLLFGIGLLSVVVSRRRHKAHHKWSHTNTGSTTATAMASTDSVGKCRGSFMPSSHPQNEKLLEQLRKDEQILPFTILAHEVQRIRQIARGGHGMVFLAKFREQLVAVKQLVSSRVSDHYAVKHFVNEIRLNSMLSHPNVVEFIGTCWTSVTDLAFVMEYMTRGDLYNLLKRHKDASPMQFDWFTSKETVAPWKSRVALDVAEALVYLHSFQRPIVHRDLKSRNVLFNDHWQAKVSDFGESCEKPMDLEDETLTMTSDVGTVAWTAPEVLQGLRYNEKADIYSFGVILSELDTCLHPYEGLVVEQSSGVTSFITSTQAALLVCAGKLRPRFSVDCPSGIQELATACLQQHASQRPSAVEIHFILRKMGAFRPDERSSLADSEYI